MKINKRDLGISLIVMMLWGSLYPMVKLGYKAFEVSTTADILVFAGLRFIICGGLITLYCVIKDRKRFATVKGSLLPILWSGVFAIVLHYSFTYIGLSLTDSSKTAILKQVGGLFYVCFSFVFFKEDKLTLGKLIGAILGFLGIIAINTSFSGLSFNLGDYLILAASFCIVFSNVISKKTFAVVDPIVLTGISQLFGGVVLFFIGITLHGKVTLVSDMSVATLSYICFASILGYCLWFLTVKRVDLSKLYIIKFAEPVFASVFGALLLKENIFKVQYLVAFILITVGILVSDPAYRKRWN